MPNSKVVIVKKIIQRVVLPTLIGAGCLWLSLRSVDLAGATAAIRLVVWPWIGIAVLGVILVSAGKALRWQWLYPESALPLPWPVHFSILLIAQMLNLVVPVRLGEVARLGLMAQERRPVGMTLGTIATEKALDLVATGLLLLFSLPVAVFPAWLGANIGRSAFITGIALLGILVILAQSRVAILRMLSGLPEPRWRPLAYLWKGALRLLAALLEGIRGITGKRFLPITGLTVLIWLLSVGVIYTVLLGFGRGDLWRAAPVLSVALIFSNLAPTPPALIGVVTAVAEGILVPFGVSPSEAFAIGVVLNVVLVAPLVALGGGFAGMRLLHWLYLPGRGPARYALGLGTADPPENDRCGEL
ncbi:MAG: lysylphosphatidylglycerol synthase transmembrane domain-containing protein [Anaerolineae bacterium]|uniref:lysylphosphatidylglycerol synthase transmembrane domain-containing protein n=1 Tax=Thermogutta sp. TaxID=1962930 RepID=UPI00321F788A